MQISRHLNARMILIGNTYLGVLIANQAIQFHLRAKMRKDFFVMIVIIGGLMNEVESRPWGTFLNLAFNENITVKLIWVDKGKKNSLQTHEKRDEYWRVMKGKIKAYIEDSIHTLNEGDVARIKNRQKHRFEGLDKENLILEISRGEFDEEDIVRFEDDYGRY